MSDALEKAARALAVHFGCEWETLRAADREMICGYVRAVLVAVRVPERDAWLSIARGQPPETRIRGAVENSFTAMIDTILEGPET